jgi:hypothetical protein
MDNNVTMTLKRHGDVLKVFALIAKGKTIDDACHAVGVSRRTYERYAAEALAPMRTELQDHAALLVKQITSARSKYIADLIDLAAGETQEGQSIVLGWKSRMEAIKLLEAIFASATKDLPHEASIGGDDAKYLEGVKASLLAGPTTTRIKTPDGTRIEITGPSEVIDGVATPVPAKEEAPF